MVSRIIPELSFVVAQGRYDMLRIVEIIHLQVSFVILELFFIKIIFFLLFTLILSFCKNHFRFALFCLILFHALV